MKHLLSAAFTLLITSVTFFSACTPKPKRPELPPATQTGENTFGCYVDGKPYAVWDGRPGLWKVTETTVDDAFANGKIYFSAQNETPRWVFDMHIYNPGKTTGTFVSQYYPFYTTATVVTDGGSMPTGGNMYQTNDSCKLTITLTQAGGRIYSGTFSGKLVNAQGKTIQITDGRFDIKRNY